MKIVELLNAVGINLLRKLTKKDLKKTYQQVSKALKRRAKTFRKYEQDHVIPERFRNGLENPKLLTRNEMLAAVSDALDYMRREESTYKGYTEKQRKRLEAYNKTMEKSGQKTFTSIDEFDLFGKFMGEMQERYGKLWQYSSDQAKELYDNAAESGVDIMAMSKRLNLDPKQLIKNFEYWSEHLEELSNADPITWHRAGRPVYASDYARKLGLPKIKDWKAK